MRVTLGPWTPDQPALGNGGLTYVRNALPAPTHWRAMRSPQQLADIQLATPTQALVSVSSLGGDRTLIYGGGNRLYRIISSTTALDLSGTAAGYATSPYDRWRMVQYGPQLVATNYADAPQVYNLGTGDPFTDLGGGPLKARYIAVVGNWLVLGDVIDPIDGPDAYRVTWNGFNNAGLPDATVWGSSIETGADFQRVADVGRIQGITGGQFGTVLCERGIVRMTRVGSPYGFQFDTIEREIGCSEPGSVVQSRAATYFLSREGFQRFDGQATQPIGREKIDRWFLGDFDDSYGHRMWAVTDDQNGLVMWLYPGSGNVSGRPNRLLIYNVDLDCWAVADVIADIIGPGNTFALDMDSEEFAAKYPDLDTADIDLNDPRLWASGPVLALVRDGGLYGLVGTPMPATFSPGEIELQEGSRAVIQRASVLYEGGAATLAIGKRETAAGNVLWSNDFTPQADGQVRCREAARWHRLRVEMTGDWSRVQGVEIDGAALGKR